MIDPENWYRRSTQSIAAKRAELDRRARDAYHRGTQMLAQGVQRIDKAIDDGVDQLKVEYNPQVAKLQPTPGARRAAPKTVVQASLAPVGSPIARGAARAIDASIDFVEGHVAPIVEYGLKAAPYAAKRLPEAAARAEMQILTNPITTAESLANALGMRDADGKPFNTAPLDKRLFPHAPSSGVIYDADGRFREVSREEFLSGLSPDQIGTLNAGTMRGSGRTLDQVLSDPHSHLDMVDTRAPDGWTADQVTRGQALMPAPSDLRQRPAQTGDRADLTPGPLGWPLVRLLKLGAIENYVDPQTGNVANVTRDSHMFDLGPDQVGVVGNFVVRSPDGGVVSRAVSVGDGANGLPNELIGPFVFRGRDETMFRRRGGPSAP